jgi:aspartyl-tRNA synthetase
MEEIDLQKLNNNRVLIKDVFRSKSKNVEVVGWVHNTRGLGKIKFLILRDVSGIIQVTAVKEKVSANIFKTINKLSRESIVYVKGSVKNSKQAPGGKEIFPKEIIVISYAEELPIDVSDFSKTELPKRLDYRFLDLHRQRVQAIFKIQSTVGVSFKEYFVNKGFIDIHTPSIIGSSSEGGTELFECKYFEKKAYLAQSPQLYKQMVACAIEKIVTITPVWRAEKHNTVRHLNEWKEMESAIQYIVKQVIKKNKRELKLLNVQLKVPKAKYLTFAEAVKLMKKYKIHVGKDDLTNEAEKKLSQLYPETIVFVYDWPLIGKPFYIMPKDEKADAELSEGFDAIYKGMEISSGGQRVHLPGLLIKRLKARGLNPKDFKNYIDSFRFGAPIHSGWSIGIERFTMTLLNLPNIREAVLFPRDRDRLSP